MYKNYIKERSMNDKECLLKDAKEAFDSKDFQKALELYKALLENDSNNPDIHYGLACVYKAMENDSEAIPAFEAALKAKPGWPCAVREYAELLLNHRKTKTALDLVKKSIELNPNDARLYVLAGKILFRQSNYEAACEYILKSLELEQNFAEAFSLLSECYFRLSKISEGLDAALNAEKYADEQKNPEMQKRCIGAYIASGQIEKTTSFLSSFSVGSCNDVQILDLLGRTYIFSGDESSLKSCASQIGKIDGEYYDYLISWAFCYRILGKHEKSRELFTEYLSENKKDAAIWSELGRTDELLGDETSALDDYSTALAFDPANFLAKTGEERLEPKDQEEKNASPSESIGEEVDFDFLMDSDFSASELDSAGECVNTESEDSVEVEEKAKPASSYSDMMAQVADLLPKIEKIISNQDEAEKFSKEIELFERLRALGNLLPDVQKQDFMQSTTRVVLEFLIARLSGKPGLLKTADSLRKSGVIDSEIQSGKADSLEHCSFAERSSAVLHSMCDFAENMEDKYLSITLIQMAKETLEKLSHYVDLALSTCKDTV